MKNIIFVCGIFFSIFIVSDAKGGNNIHYCVEEKSNGFKLNEKTHIYEHSGFTTKKWVMKLDLKNKTISLQGGGVHQGKPVYKCKLIFSPELLSCHYYSNTFNYNIKNGRFVSSFGYGFVGGDHDVIWISYGTCTKF